MDQFTLQEAYRFQGEQVVKEEGVGVFQSTDNTSKEEATLVHVCVGEGGTAK